MLLAEFTGRAHVQIDDDRREAVDLHQVRAFVFGESYLIKMKNGKSFDVRDLDTILSVMHDEFALWRNQLAPEIEVVSEPNINQAKNPLGFGSVRTLLVHAVQPGVFIPQPPVQKMVDKVRLAVTMYNISGSWDQFQKGNL